MDNGQADQNLFDAAACGLLVTAADGLILRANRTFCEWVGREPAELIGLATMQSLLSMGGRIFHQTHMAPLVQIQGSVREVKLEIVHKDGRRIPMIWNAVRRVNDGTVTHDLAAFIAEDRHRYERELMLARQKSEAALLKELEAQRDLRAAQVELDRLRLLAEDRALFAEQMMAVVSHDLRNPLSVIKMSSSLILRGGGLTDRQQRSLMQLESSTDRAIRLISDLLDFSQGRIGGGLRVDLEEADLQLIVAANIDELQVAHPEAVLQHVRIGHGLRRFSPDKITQMIGNLVWNAVSYGAPGRPIVITSTVEEAGFSISVHNEGPSIPAHQLPTLFEALTRGDDGESANHSLGLGLYIVREICKAHGGDVAVRSEGEETTFTATFPRSPATPGARAGAAVGTRDR